METGGGGDGGGDVSVATAEMFPEPDEFAGPTPAFGRGGGRSALKSSGSARLTPLVHINT
jgi:hypothetical protein